MKSKSLIILTLTSLLSLSNGVNSAESDGLSCCLADEWIADGTAVELQQSATAAAPTQSSELTCCLASEWTAPSAVEASVSQDRLARSHISSDFCCIADEWKL